MLSVRDDDPVLPPPLTMVLRSRATSAEIDDPTPRATGAGRAMPAGSQISRDDNPAAAPVLWLVLRDRANVQTPLEESDPYPILF